MWLAVLATLIFTFTPSASAQNNQSLLIMRAGNTTMTNCEGAAEINYQIASDLKLNNASEIRLLNSPGGLSDSMEISRKNYEDAPKNKLVNMYQIKWQDNVLTAASGKGQTPFVVLPEGMKPEKTQNPRINSFYSALLTGEARDGKQKKKISLNLSDVWKIYFMRAGESVNDVLFAHALEERSVVLWEIFLQKTSNHRAAEANANMRDVLISCAQASLEQFKNGNYRALEVAKQRVERAQSVKNDVDADKLVVEINQHKQRVNNAREQVFQLIGSGRWDEAITAAEPIKIYLSSWDDLNSMYNGALKSSHEQHLTKGKQALESNQLDAALTECTVAWKRLSDSAPARECVCTSRIRVAVRDSTNFRQRKQPKLAKERVEDQLGDSDCTRDAVLLKELETAKREYAEQLFTEARQLVSGGAPTASAPKPAPRGKGKPAPQPPPSGVSVKTIAAQNKQDFRNAREKLLLAEEMSSAENARMLLNKVNLALAGYCLAEGRKALQRNDFGTAYVYLMSAQNYTPESDDITTLLNQARTQFEERTRVSIGVIFENRSGVRNSESVLNDISNEIESIATNVGLARPVILDRTQAANAWRAIQGNGNLTSPTAIFSGDLLNSGVNINSADRTVRSSYTYENPEWESRDRQHDAVNDQYKSCKKQSGELACAGLASRVAELKRWRDSVERYLKQYYDYYEKYYKVSGSARLSFRYTDSISRSVGAAETLSASVTDECVARSGVHEKDYSARNKDCYQIQSESGYMDKMSRQLRIDANSRASSLLRSLPLSYYKRAKSAVNRQQSVEDYLRFLFLTGNKNGSEAEEAKRFLLAFDAELKTDGVLR